MCKACKVTYRRISDLRNHISRTHLKQKFIKCRLCEETFMYHSQRKAHMYSQHSVEKPEKFVCGHCGRQFGRKNTLAEHMMDVHIEKSCQHCDLKFARKRILFHMNEAHSVPMPTCGICGLRTLKESSLVRHQRNVHLNEKDVVCKVCKRRFFTRSNLQDHMITHNQDRVFKCDVCGKSFARKECFRTHYRIHTGERPYRCALCGATFVQRAGLRFHGLSVAAQLSSLPYIRIIEDQGAKLYSCSECHVQKEMYAMQRHINDQHRDIKEECPICGEQLRTRVHKKQHLRKCHNLEEIRRKGKKELKARPISFCDICKKEYTNKRAFANHMNYHHTLSKCPDCPSMFPAKDMAVHRNDAHGTPMPMCGICGYRNALKYRVLVHQRRVHLREKTVPCEFCNLMFFNVMTLKRHLIKHKPDRIHECSYCHKKFPRIGTLRMHEKIHKGEKDKVCSICSERFVQKASLNYHMVKQHPNAC